MTCLLVVFNFESDPTGSFLLTVQKKKWSSLLIHFLILDHFIDVEKLWGGNGWVVGAFGL